MKIVASPVLPAAAAASDSAAVLALQTEVTRLREELAAVRAEMAQRLTAAPAGALPVPPVTEEAPLLAEVPAPAPIVIPDVALEPVIIPEPLPAAPAARERATDPFFVQLWAYVSHPSA